LAGLVLATVLPVRGAAAGALAWSGDGRLLAGGDVTGRVHVWDLAAAPAVLRAPGLGPLSDIDVHADGRRVAAADVRGQAAVWDLDAQRVVLRLAHAVPTESRGLRFHPSLPQLSLGTLGGGAQVYSLDGGALLGSAEGSFDALAWHRSSGRLLSGGQDGVVRSHAPGTAPGTALAEPHADAVVALAVAGEVVYSADTRGVVKARAASPGSAPTATTGPGSAESGTLASVTNAAGKAFSVDALAFAPDGRRWLAAGSAGDVLVFDRSTRQRLLRLETGADQVNSAAFSPDGRFVAALDNVGRLHLWEAAEGRRHAVLWLRNEPGRAGSDAFGLLGPLRRLAWLPDSRRLAIATQSGAALLVALPADDAPAR
jgi:WD40 repeat protein